MSRDKLKILIVRLSAIGDVINTLPALTVLREHYPSAIIGWLVEDKAAAILADHPFLDRIFIFKRREWQKKIFRFCGMFDALREFLSFIFSIRHERFTVALDFQGNLKSAVLVYLGRPSLRAGYCRKDSKEFNFLFSHRQVSVPGHIKHRVEKHLFLLTVLGIEPEPRYPVISTSSAEDRYIRQRLGEKREKIVVMHPGTSEVGAYKQWETRKFARLADRLTREKGVRIIITCGPKEHGLGIELQQNAREQVTLFSPPTIKVLAHLLKSADLFIGADTGPLYIASAVRTPVVALFGPTDPEVYGPFFGKKEIVWKRRPCCPCKDRQCTSMQLIEVDEVFDRASKLLDC